MTHIVPHCQILLIRCDLFVSQRLSREHTRCRRRRIQRRQQRDSDRNRGDNHPVERARREGQRVDGVDLGREMNEVVVSAGPRRKVAEREAQYRPDRADQESL